MSIGPLRTSFLEVLLFLIGVIVLVFVEALFGLSSWIVTIADRAIATEEPSLTKIEEQDIFVMLMILLVIGVMFLRWKLINLSRRPDVPVDEMSQPPVSDGDRIFHLSMTVTSDSLRAPGLPWLTSWPVTPHRDDATDG